MAATCSPVCGTSGTNSGEIGEVVPASKSHHPANFSTDLISCLHRS
jgi:hypothetical protein